MKVILTLILLILSYSYGEEDLIKIAKMKAYTKRNETTLNKALKSYNEGLYSDAIQIIENLMKRPLSDIDTELANLIYVHALYKNREEEKMYNYIKNLDIDKFTQYGKYRIYQIAMLLFLERKNKEGENFILEKLGLKEDGNIILDKQENETEKIIDIILKDKISKKEKINNLVKDNNIKFYGKDSEIINYKGVDFILNRNIFKLDKDIPIIGELSIYISEKDQTLLEISKKLGLGYYELKNANPLIDPFDVRKNQIIIVPLKRILPFKNFEYNVIYINIYEKRLYLPVKINDESYVITFPIGIGTDEAQSPIGEFKISQKEKNPVWIPPESIRKEQPDLPAIFPAGPDNPLGTRAMRLGNTTFLMHGTNKEYGIGMRVSHGCIRMYNEDVEKLFEVVNLGTKVVSNEFRYKMYSNSNSIKVVEAFDDNSINDLEKSGIVSKKFLNFYKTTLFGKSFAITVW